MKQYRVNDTVSLVCQKGSIVYLSDDQAELAEEFLEEVKEEGTAETVVPKRATRKK